MATKIQFRRDTAANWASANPILAQGELGLVLDTGRYKIGNGTDNWNTLGFTEFTATVNSVAYNAVTDPAAPGSGIIMYDKLIGGRNMPKFIPPSGLDTPLQPAIFSNGMSFASSGSGTALSYTGMGAMTAVGTVSTPALASTTFRTALRRSQVLSSASANSAAELRYSQTQCWLGGGNAGQGGFFAVFRWALPSAVSGQRSAVGLFSTTSAISASQQPSSLTNCIFVGNDNSDTNMQIMCNDATSTCTKTDLGSNFVLSGGGENIYELVLFARQNDTQVSYRIAIVNGVGLQEGTLTTNIPSTTTFLAPHFYANNNGVASAVQLDFFRYYLETDY